MKLIIINNDHCQLDTVASKKYMVFHISYITDNIYLLYNIINI